MAAAPSIRWTTITLDCANAEALASFYSRVFGWEITARDGAGWVQLRNPDGGIGLNIQAEDTYAPPVWPERAGAQAKMMHFEILVDDLDAAVRLVIDSGGSQAAHQPLDRDRTRVRIMHDPAEHPFCLFVYGE
jgi:predicted enzyme related to lactoylglutathione lyase